MPQLAACLKDEFVQFLPVVMTALLSDASKDIDFKIVDAKEAELEDGEEDETPEIQKMQIAIKGVEGTKQIQKNTSVLENKIMAIQVIRKIASSLGKLFFSQVEVVSKLVTESLMRDKFSSAIRKESTKMLNTLLMCTNDSEQMKVLINLYLPALGMQINTRLAAPQGPDFRSVKWLMQETARCFNHFYNYGGAFLTDEMAVNLVGLMGKVLEQVSIDKE